MKHLTVSICISLLTVANIFNIQASFGQTKSPVQFSDSKPTIVYNTGKEQNVILTVTHDTTVFKDDIFVDVVALPISGSKDYFIFNSHRMAFGLKYDLEQKIKITLKSDTTFMLPALIRIVIKSSDTELVHHDIYYQPSSELSKTTDNKLLKSNDDLKADFNTLRSQLLDGDTSRTYIGKLVLKPSAIVIPAKVDFIKSKTDLDDFIRQTKKSSQFRDTINDETKVKYQAVDIQVPVNKSTAQLIKKELDSNYLDKKRQPINVDYYKKITVVKKNIDTVVVKITEGMIEYIKVKMTDNSYFINLFAPISLLTIEKHFNDRLFNPETREYIFLKDAIVFSSEKRFNFFPSDAIVYLNNNAIHPIKEVKVFANNGLNTFVDFRVFTDLLGALNNQANGLLQIEAKSKIYLHRGSLRDKFAYIFYGLEPYFGLSKFDSKYDTIKITDATKPIDRVGLFQRSFVNVGMKINIFRADFRPSNSFYINGGYQFNAGNLAIRDAKNKIDSIVAKGMLHTSFFEVGLSSTRLSNFGFDGSAKIIFQELNKSQYFSNSGFNRLINFSVTAFYYPGIKPKDKFFVRFVNYLNFSDRTKDFYQLQFGYSLNLKI